MSAAPGSLVGCVVGGQYKLKRLIGQGAMGEVYSAEGSAGEVALKVLHDRAAADPDLVARFQREAHIAGQIHSPYVAAVLGAGKDRNGRLWIAFERLVGEGLDELVKREQHLPFAEVAPIVRDTLRGLEAAHSAGVVHRDIKPANLFIEQAGTEGPRTRILDFGVSKFRARGKADSSLTAFDATLGSFAYMAPEQVRGSARVDARADLYAVGAVAFRMLTGRLPFEGPNAITLIALKLERNAPTLSSMTGEVWPSRLEDLFRRIMSRDRDQRFSSAGEAQDAWAKVCEAMGETPHPRLSRPVDDSPEDGPDDALRTLSSTLTSTHSDTPGRDDGTR